MLYFPSRAEHSAFKAALVPLPAKLFSWLVDTRGLSVCVTPDDKEKTTDIILRRLGYDDLTFPGDTRDKTEASFYCPARNLIVLHRKDLLSRRSECTVTHEIAHALDYLYYPYSIQGYRLSDSPEVIKALRPSKPLNEYCRKKNKLLGNQTEQFACSFAAYFREKDYHSWGNSIEDLSRSFIKFMNNHVIKRFE